MCFRKDAGNISRIAILRVDQAYVNSFNSLIILLSTYYYNYQLLIYYCLFCYCYFITEETVQGHTIRNCVKLEIGGIGICIKSSTAGPMSLSFFFYPDLRWPSLISTVGFDVCLSDQRHQLAYHPSDKFYMCMNVVLLLLLFWFWKERCF